MASVFKPKGAAKYMILYTDENGRRRKKVACGDRSVSVWIARDLGNQVALRRLGLVDPQAEAYRDHEARFGRGSSSSIRLCLPPSKSIRYVGNPSMP
jgi:hypothetical protein